MVVRCVGKCNFSGLCPDHGERGHSFRVADDPGVNGDKLISFASLLDICSRCQSVLNGGRYYMDLGVENQSDTAIASQDMRAYIAGPSGAVLRILVLDPKDGPIQPGKKRDYILDVAGYTDALLRGGSTSAPATIYVYVAEGLFSGLLPNRSELMDKTPVNIPLQNTTDIPDVEEVAPLKVGRGEWGVLGTDGPPEVARIQGLQASFYFYYEHAPIIKVADFHQASSIGEEMAKVGVGSDFNAVVVEEKPWPKP